MADDKGTTSQVADVGHMCYCACKNLCMHANTFIIDRFRRRGGGVGTPPKTVGRCHNLNESYPGSDNPHLTHVPNTKISCHNVLSPKPNTNVCGNQCKAITKPGHRVY